MVQYGFKSFGSVTVVLLLFRDCTVTGRFSVFFSGRLVYLSVYGIHRLTLASGGIVKVVYVCV
jgi:hypothetical protein